MIVFWFVSAALLYGAATLIFLILSSAELLERGMSTPSRLSGVLVCSTFWPLTIVVLSLYGLYLTHWKPAPAKSGRRLAQLSPRAH